jgi:hypothetical protein
MHLAEAIAKQPTAQRDATVRRKPQIVLASKA